MKKIMMGFLIGLLMLGVTACGSTTAAKDVTANFQNSVFIGDSITEGFVVNEIRRNLKLLGQGLRQGLFMMILML